MPIINDKIFKQALLAVLKDEMDAKRAGGAKNNALSIGTAKYYGPLIEEANNDLKQLHTGLAARLKPALHYKKRREILGTLGARLEYYTWQYHRSLGHDNNVPNPTTQEVNDLCAQLGQNPLPPGISPDFLARHAVRTIKSNFIAYVTDVLTHVNTDWNDIQGAFFPTYRLAELQEITVTGSDSHKGGKAVVLLQFKGEYQMVGGQQVAAVAPNQRNVFTRVKSKPLRLVYKPSDLSLDYMMVGDTQTVSQAVAGLAGITPPNGSLFETINALVTAGNVQAVNNPDPFQNRPLPTALNNWPFLPIYSILPRNLNQGIHLRYGYLEFLTHYPKPMPTGQVGEFNARVRNSERARWDWITDQNDDLIDYYRVFGWYIAIAMNFGIADAHNENMIVHGKKPYLIDLEISFKWKCETLGNTGLQDVMSSWGPSRKGDKCQIIYKNGANLEYAKGIQAANYIVAGMNEAADLLQRDPGNTLAGPGGWLDFAGLAGAYARYTVRPTRDYGNLLRTIYYAAPLQNLGAFPNDGVTHACMAPVPNPGNLPSYHAFFPKNGSIRWWYNGLESEHRPNFVENDPQHAWTDYLNCDYPAFYRQLNTLNLTNSQGVAVQVAQPAAYNLVGANRDRQIAGAHYFDHYPAVHLFDVDVAALPIPIAVNHLNGHVIADLGGSFGQNGINLTPNAAESTEKDDEQWRIIDSGFNPTRIFHIRYQQGTIVSVFEAGSAIQMAQRQYERFRNDLNFRTTLITRAQQDVANQYPPQNIPPSNPTIYDGF